MLQIFHAQHLFWVALVNVFISAVYSNLTVLMSC